MISNGYWRESLSRCAIPYGVSQLVKHCDAGTRGRSGLGIIWFWGLDDNLGLVECLSGSSRGGSVKATDPPDDILRAFACASARDLDISEERNKLIWELEWFLQLKGKRTRNTMRDWVSFIRHGGSVNRGNCDVVWYNR